MCLAFQVGPVAIRQQLAHAQQLRAGLAKKKRQRFEGRFIPDIFNQSVENGAVEIGYGLSWHGSKNKNKKMHVEGIADGRDVPLSTLAYQAAESPDTALQCRPQEHPGCRRLTVHPM